LAGQQDRFSLYNQATSSIEALPVVADSGSYFEAQAKVAESLGMSRSIVKQMRDREYSYDQIEKLLQQRRHVLDVIRKTEGTSAQSTSPPTPSKNNIKVDPPAEAIIASSGTTSALAVQPTTTIGLPMSPAGTPSNTPSTSTANTPIQYANPGKSVPCNFQICHNCRPFFPDRLHMSFDAVRNNEIPPITEEDASKLRVLDAKVVSNLGLRPLPLRPNLTPTVQDDCDADSMAHMNQGDGYDDDTSPTDTTISDDSRFFLRDEQELLPCPGRGFCPVWSENEGCAYYNGFDDGKRAINHAMQFDDSYNPEALQMAYQQAHHDQMATTSTPAGSSSTGSSISLPEPRIEPLTPPSPDELPFGIDLENRLSKVGKAATVCGVLTKDSEYSEDLSEPRIEDKDSNSSLGDEVEVDGGVALTEEAVERGVPDIVTDEK
jgi:hypothetical protein